MSGEPWFESPIDLGEKTDSNFENGFHNDMKVLQCTNKYIFNLMLKIPVDGPNFLPHSTADLEMLVMSHST
jgi:hypothetical protein